MYNWVYDRNPQPEELQHALNNEGFKYDTFIVALSDGTVETGAFFLDQKGSWLLDNRQRKDVNENPVAWCVFPAHPDKQTCK